MRWDKSDQFEIKKIGDKYVTYVVGNVVFITETGKIYCDSAMWIKGEEVSLNGNVLIDDADYKIAADSVLYNIAMGELLSLGKQVELWSYKDSLYASGVHAFYSENDQSFFMEQRPVVYFGYPDTANMTEVIANRIDYDRKTESAQALGNVKITSQEFSAQSNCAKMNLETKDVDLYDKPTAQKDESDIKGEMISIIFENDQIKTIEVIDSAYAHFKEEVDTINNFYDESILSGRMITLNFAGGEMHDIICYDQAYCWYYPSQQGKPEKHENNISGDTIKFDIAGEQLRQVNVIGGAIGRYIATKSSTDDSGLVSQQVDTIDYNSRSIAYQVKDSLIVLKQNSSVKSGSVSLDAHQIEFDTRMNLIEAFSADVDADTVINPYHLSEVLQPNVIPVKLKDGSEEIFGDYMLYSIDTKKGRIVQSKTNYQTGYYYGQKLYREQEEVYYVNTGRYTTCDADEPHFHFRSNNMKLIEDDKLIAKPIIFYIERIPILALPYYIFPLKKGRHSGILPFDFGQFERGERYVKDVGYYWAASEYWDWQGSFDYYEQNRTLNFSSRISFRQRYVLDGFVSGDYTRVTGYNRTSANEFKTTRWTLRGAYNHIFSPTFDISSSANFQSDESYYSDYSQYDSERINRSIISQLSFRKKFGKSTSISGNVSHTENLDQQSRIDYLPNVNFSFPTFYPFGSGSIDENGKKQVKWYHKFNIRYSPKVRNYSSRTTIIDTIIIHVDTNFVTDPETGITELFIDSLSDTLSHRSRKEYTRVTHNPSINLPSIKMGNYLNVIPRFSYNESWAKVHSTDQSDTAAFDDSKMYRTYSYSTGVTANTSLYGTLYPNMFGLIGIRHVLTPSATYSYSPDLNRHAEVRSYVGGMAGSSKGSTLTFSLRQLILAKVNHKGIEENKQIISVNSAFSYNYLNDERPFSNLTTSFQSSALPIISSLSGSMTHTFYDPITGEEKFWKPKLTNFQIDMNLRLAGDKFIFDETTRHRELPRGADSLSQLPQTGGSRTGRSGWSFSANYNYTEYRNGSALVKSSFINFDLSFSLTANTYITYTQRYRISDKLTTHNSVNITRKIHCWTGSLYWIPIGSNRGFGFKLYVTDMPEIKIDNNYSGLTQTLQR